MWVKLRWGYVVAGVGVVCADVDGGGIVRIHLLYNNNINKEIIMMNTDTRVEGWLTRNEGELLYLMARSCRHPLVEIGSYKGKSTIHLGMGSQDGHQPTVYAVDTWHDYFGSGDTKDEFRKNIDAMGLNEIISPIRSPSNKAVNKFQDGILDLVFIDGNHNLALEDYRLWLPKLRDGGFMVVHDTTSSLLNKLPGWPEPKKVANHMFHSSGFKQIGLCDTITWGVVGDSGLLGSFGKRGVWIGRRVPDLLHHISWFCFGWRWSKFSEIKQMGTKQKRAG